MRNLTKSGTQHGKLNPHDKGGVVEQLRFLIEKALFVRGKATNLHYSISVQNVGLSVALQLTGVFLKCESFCCYLETKAEINLKVCFL